MKKEIDTLTVGNTDRKPLRDKKHHLYRQIVGKFMYSIVKTRLNFAYALNVLSNKKKFQNPFLKLLL